MLTGDALLSAVRGLWLQEQSSEFRQQALEMVEQGYPLDDIQDFVEQYGAEAFIDGHYLTWCELTENGQHSDVAVRAFVALNGIELIGSFENAYVGAYDKAADFAEDYFRGNYDNISEMESAGMVFDWEASWVQHLRYSYDFKDGYVFVTDVA